MKKSKGKRHLRSVDMATTNPITGDKIQTRPSTKYADNYETIFGKKDAGTLNGRAIKTKTSARNKRQNTD